MCQRQKTILLCQKFLKKESDLAQTTIFNDSNMTEDILLTRSLSKELGLDQNEEKKE